jgi:hypothetical protein
VFSLLKVHTRLLGDWSSFNYLLLKYCKCDSWTISHKPHLTPLKVLEQQEPDHKALNLAVNRLRVLMMHAEGPQEAWRPCLQVDPPLRQLKRLQGPRGEQFLRRNVDRKIQRIPAFSSGSADVFVCGVLCTRSASIMDFNSFDG